jgi:hypothetical protein
MRAWWALALVATMAAGCVQHGEQAIEQARGPTAANGTPLDGTTPPTPEESVASGASDVTVNGVNVTDDGAVAPTPPSPSPSPSPNPAPSPTPPPTAPSPPPTPTWPREGSTVSYTIESGKGFTDYGEDVYANATWRYHDGDWRGSCDAQVHQQFEDGNGAWTYNNSTFHVDYTPANPPHWPLFDTTSPPAVGGDVLVWSMEGCTIVNETMVYNGTATTPEWGTTHTAHDTDIAEQNYSSFRTWWRTDTGLVDAWSWGRLHSYSIGHLTSLT